MRARIRVQPHPVKSEVRRIIHVDMDAFMRRSSSATTRRCAASRWPSAASPARAGWWRRRATKRAPSACARRCHGAGSAPVSGARHRQARFPALPRRLAAGPRHLPFVHALVEPLSLMRPTWTSPITAGRGSGDAGGEAVETAHPRGGPADGFGRGGAEQVPRQDRLRMAEARRADRDLARPGRAFLQQLPVDALWGVGPVTAGKLRKIGIERWSKCAQPTRMRCGRALAVCRGAAAAGSGRRSRPVVPDRPTSLRAARIPTTRICWRWMRYARDRAYGAPDRGLARAQGIARAHGHDQGPLCRFQHRHAQHTAAAPTRDATRSLRAR